jgi:hypothetical protein
VAAEGEHRAVVRILHADARLHPVPHRDQERDREQPVGEADRGGHAEELAHHERPPRHRLADDHEHGLRLDLPGERGGGREGGQQHAHEQERAQPHVDEQLVVVLEGVGRDVDVEQQRQQAGRDQHGVHRLADRFAKGVGGDGENRHFPHRTR